MRVTDYPTKLFLDSGNPADTELALSLLGRLDGQTTNPSLIVKNPDIQAKIQNGSTLTNDELLDEYKRIVTEISHLIPDGSVSIEVYADEDSSAHELLDQAKMMNEWIPNAHIKFPTTMPGLIAAQQFVERGGKVNMTLGFSESQALAVHQATLGAQVGDVFYSSFIGRVFDKGINGIQLLDNTIERLADSPVQILAASFRSLDQLKASIVQGADIVTIPPKLLTEWSQESFEISDDFNFTDSTVTDYTPEEISDHFDWITDLIIPDQAVDGVIKFAQDWNSLLGK